MEVEHVGCAKCGAPLDIRPDATMIGCQYCGSQCRINRDPTGLPFAILANIKSDTEILAKRATIDHLQTRLNELQSQFFAQDDTVKKLESKLKLAGSHYEVYEPKPSKGKAICFKIIVVTLTLAALICTGLYCSINDRPSTDWLLAALTTLAVIGLFSPFVIGLYLLGRFLEKRHRSNESKWIENTQRERDEQLNPIKRQLAEAIKARQQYSDEMVTLQVKLDGCKKSLDSLI
jgi:hypothetical protein